jgi:hypothetical protein
VCCFVPLQVYGVVFNQFMPQNASMFVTYGVKHVKFWISAIDEVGQQLQHRHCTTVAATQRLQHK